MTPWPKSKPGVYFRETKRRLLLPGKDFTRISAPFLIWLAGWEAALKSVRLGDLVAGEPNRVALVCVDLVVGFCYEGALASPRVARIVPPIVALCQKAHAAGVRHFVLTQDSHPPDAVEFDAYAPHCVTGTREAETAPELLALSFADEFAVVPKNSINSAIGTGLDDWLEANAQVDTFIVVGDCTDLCTYQLAMHLRLRANALALRQRVILPANCVATYDLPVETAQSLGILPHDGDLLHAVFLYSMASNGVEVVAEIV
jgi:nicotinamidase-related amidase